MSQFDYLQERQRLIDAGAYELESERSACGVGLIADIKGEPRRETVELGLKALKAVWHRGTVDADGKTGDGAGLRLGIAQDFFKAAVARTGHEPSDHAIGVGMVFLPRTDFGAQEKGRTIVETEVLRAGLRLFNRRRRLLLRSRRRGLDGDVLAARRAALLLLEPQPQTREMEDVAAR